MAPVKELFTPVRPVSESGNGNGNSGSENKGLKVRRYLTNSEDGPYDGIQWETRKALIEGDGGEVVFEQDGVEVPSFWSQQATHIVASKYFRGHMRTPEREFSVRQIVDRVANQIRDWGIIGGYFADRDSADAFGDELKSLLVHQMASFNSPVWFNIGVENVPQQASACFLTPVSDSMGGIMDLARTESIIFKGGSGSGVNLSSLRGSSESLSGGGISSGPISFMRGLDAFAGAIKSGGRTRRAATIRILDDDHPDIIAFINCKALEEKKAWSLIDAGYDGGFNVPGGAYDSVAFQNANHSVRVSDLLMSMVVRAFEAPNECPVWYTHNRLDGSIAGGFPADEILLEISEAAHLCGDPGLIFKDTMNRWHTCKNDGEITTVNPCSEYCFLTNTACNLASINLVSFLHGDEFDTHSFIHACEIFIIAQEILVGFADYPTPEIEAASKAYRTLGLGYCNLGALLMCLGLPYDSNSGRNVAATITALMTGVAYRQSAEIAAVRDIGPFERYPHNREPMLAVIKMHRSAAYELGSATAGPGNDLAWKIATDARNEWDKALSFGEKYGYRNAQVTVLAPTGTISFMMDAATTGIEPELGLVKYKKLVGGGTLKMVNPLVGRALENMTGGGCDPQAIHDICDFVKYNGTIEGQIKDKWLPVFDCAFPAKPGGRCIGVMGHLKMMAAVQPFLSGAISKTCNVPESITPEEIAKLYADAWQMGLKSVAIYRENSKRSAPLSTGTKKKETLIETQKVSEVAPARTRLPSERRSLTHKFQVGEHKGYVTVGMYENGKIGEIFITMNKEGSTLSGLLDSFATSVSLGLQYGVPIEVFIRKFAHTRFEPSGFTGNSDVPLASSILDYIFRWIEKRFSERVSEPADAPQDAPAAILRGLGDNGDIGPACPNCGALMQQAGACYSCSQCGETGGCG